MNNRTGVTRLLTRKGDLGTSHIHTAERSLLPASGEVILKLDRFSLSTNNITYAAFGDSMNYWAYFPTHEEQWGHMPVWGFADVVASDTAGIAVGERFYGYFPIASHVWFQPERVSERGFYDGAPHRRDLFRAYNQYTRCRWDPYYNARTEGLQALLKPLFLTSFLLADFLQDNAFFGARRLVISSASSKTAYGTAACLEGSGVELVGLTSAGNRDFVTGLGCYRQTIDYDQLGTLDNSTPTAYVDFSGDLELRDAVHRHFGDNLRYSCFAGSAQTTDPARLTSAVGPTPVFFFAAEQIRKRNRDWGPQEVDQRIGEGLLRFYSRVGHGPKPWLKLIESEGYDAAAEIIARLYRGTVDPQEGHIVRLQGSAD